MKLTTIANTVILNHITTLVVESAAGDAASIENEIQDLASELKASGEDITDEEVQAAMLSALIDADGDIAKVDVEDIESIKTEIYESRNFVLEAGGPILSAIHVIGDILGNAAFVHELTAAIDTATGKKIDEAKLKARLDSIFEGIKKVTGLPAKVMEKAFEWIVKQFGASERSQKIAGLTGTLVVTIVLFAIGVVLFPSVSSTILFTIGIMSLIGKSAEIIKLIKEIVHLLKKSETKITTN